MLLAIAEAVVDDCEKEFLAGLGVAERVAKGPYDFATTADLKIELMLRRELTTMTGIPVYGEEGGGSLDDPVVWVVDPIDGTSNYAAGNPMCAILVSLLHQGRPIVALCSLPTMGKRLTAFEGSPLMVNGKPQPKLRTPVPQLVQIGLGSQIAINSETPQLALRRELMADLVRSHTRLRVTGSVGVDTAFTALGIFAGSVTFSPFAWDNAAGVLLVQAAGGTATDLEGKPWQPHSVGLVVGAKNIHKEILATINQICDEEEYKA